MTKYTSRWLTPGHMKCTCNTPVPAPVIFVVTSVLLFVLLGSVEGDLIHFLNEVSPRDLRPQDFEKLTSTGKLMKVQIKR